MAKSEVSDEDVQSQLEEVEALRQKVADAEQARLDKERSDNNAITMAQLEAEKARLLSQLTVAEAEAKSAGADEGESPLANARAAAAAAAEQQKAQEEALKKKAEADAEQAKIVAKQNEGEQ